MSNSDHKHQVHHLSKINYDKEMKENCRANLTSIKDAFQLELEETQKLLEDQHLDSLQKFCDEVNQIANSESLSSMDSLEAGEREQIYLTLSKDHSTSGRQDSISLGSTNLQSTNLSCFDEDKLSFSKTQHINNWLINLDDPNTQTVTSFSDMFNKPNALPSGECPNSAGENTPILSSAVERTANTANNPVAFVHSPRFFAHNKKNGKTSEASTGSSSGTFKMESPFVTESPNLKFNKSWARPDSPAREVATFLDQEKYSELTQQNSATSVHTSYVPVATPLVLPPTAQSARPLPKDRVHIREIDPVQCSDKLDDLKDIKNENMHHFNNNKEELPLFIDDIQAAYMPHNPDSKNKTQKTTETLSTVMSNDTVSFQKKMKYNIHDRNGVSFLKSILKKESKYDHHYFEALMMNQDCRFGYQKAAAIRDSIELRKEKGKGADIQKTIKRLRWFDDADNMANNAEENHSRGTRAPEQWGQQLYTQMKSGVAGNITGVPSSAVNVLDRKRPTDNSVTENVTLGGSEADHVPSNCVLVPSGCNFAKQAWLASKKEESKPLAHSGDSTIQNVAKPQKDGADVSRRTRSAKVQSGLYTNRRGTVVQPHSASKAKSFIQTQGKLMVPHPPPKPTTNIRSGKNVKISQCQSVMPENSQNVAHNCFNSKYVHPVEHRFNPWTRGSSPPLSDACSNKVTVIPLLPSPCGSECQTLAKINHSSSIQMVAHQDGKSYCTQRCPVFEESKHKSFKTLKTTGEESVPLWKRGHNILGQNERTADSTVPRRKQIVENKQKGLLELKRQNSGFLGHKYSEQIHNSEQNLQISSSEAKQNTKGTSNNEEVSDSTSEFLMAENLVKISVPEDEILAVMNSKQLQKPNLAVNNTQRPNMCALSAEEQKILQSLNHLNERLHYMQETVCKNPPINNILQMIPLLNSQPQARSSPAATGSRLQRK
ncbi:centrosomal protein of 126 kDa isoform X1 [Echinops telfairi]|nr:centrosomal protein of 126 kDa isoform X1 [Echinops telfairi]XP_045153729.1 centrosomal protein of 126 kDa isoform X1 [Echinops telfairi]XP_045153730.1 centrosomal protein of 126 kDa isoform X1 [Echinops telfairi]